MFKIMQFISMISFFLIVSSSLKPKNTNYSTDRIIYLKLSSNLWIWSCWITSIYSFLVFIFIIHFHYKKNSFPRCFRESSQGRRWITSDFSFVLMFFWLVACFGSSISQRSTFTFEWAVKCGIHLFQKSKVNK